MDAANEPPAAPPAGARAVVFETCVSCVLLTFRRTSRVHMLRPGQWAWLRGLPYTLATLLLGWWGVPWGLVYTPRALWTNLTGGRAVAGSWEGR